MNRCRHTSKRKLENLIINQSDVEERPVPHGSSKKLNVEKEQTSHMDSSKRNDVTKKKTTARLPEELERAKRSSQSGFLS